MLKGKEQLGRFAWSFGGLFIETVVLPVPSSTKLNFAATLRASIKSWSELAEVFRAKLAAAVVAAESAALCIVRLVKYQLPTSVPSPANPMMPDRDTAKSTAAPPLRSLMMLREARNGWGNSDRML